jgi:uncharacterized protein YkwD
VRRAPPRLLALLPLLAGLAACMISTTAPPAAPPVPAGDARVLEQRIHQAINRHRASRSLPPLRYDARLAEIAREHSAAMATRLRPFGHAGFADRVRAITAVLPHGAVAENVALNSRSGDALVRSVSQGWIASAGHRSNLEGPYQWTGVGVAQGAGGAYYVTQLFVAAP